MLDVSKYRDSFPILKENVQLSSCSQSALHQNVKTAINKYLHTWESDGMNWDAWMSVCEDAREKFARLINADPEEIAIVSSVSHAVSALATSLHRSNSKNRVFITGTDFHVSGMYGCHKMMSMFRSSNLSMKR